MDPAEGSESPPARGTSVRTVGQTVLVFGGNMSATALGFVTNILIMRALGPEGFGVVIVATTFLTVLWQLTGRGLDQALVRCVAMFARTDSDRADQACRTVHHTKLVVGTALGVLGMLAAWPVTRFFIGPDASLAPVWVAAACSVPATLWGYTGACLQAMQTFTTFTMVQVANAVARLAMTAGMIVAGVLTPALAMLATGAAYLGAAGLGYGFLSPRQRGFRAEPDLRFTIYRYSRWLVLSSVIYLLYTRLDQLMLSRLSGPQVAGIYGAAVTFIQLVDLLTSSLLTVFLPQVCATESIAELRRRTRQSLAVSALLTIPVALSFILLRPAMDLLLGARFAAALPVFTIIFPGAVFNMLTHPLQVVLHARGRTEFITVLDILVLIANGAANYFAITAYGMIGAAVVALVTRVLAGLLLGGLVARELALPVAGGGRPA